MKFTDFANDKEISPIPIHEVILNDLEFLLENRGDVDMELYACEAFIFPLLKGRKYYL